ncbi:MAG: hypothetical protein JXC85_03235 [Candidatus Aenigmarchaeota archaeon]|nr:hypothetical protein [Candidatus Aenigmarchaeota archaeon]
MGKAQSIIFEQVLLFMISVAIFIICFALFQIYENHYSFVALNDQIKAVRDMITAQVIQLVKHEGMDVSASLSIPKRISGEYYDIRFIGTGLNVSLAVSKIAATSDLFRLGERFSFSGNSTSAKGEIIIYKRGNNIILE